MIQINSKSYFIQEEEMILPYFNKTFDKTKPEKTEW